MRAEAEAPLARARRIAPLVAAAAPRIEAERALTPEVLEALHGAGLFRTLIPRRFRGEEVAPQDYVVMMIEIARADASTAWCIGQGSGCSMAAAYVKPEVAEAVWGAADAVLSWGMGPQSRAHVVDGGYRVTGQWHFASGSRHSAWLGGHCRIVERDGTFRPDETGAPVERTMLFRREQAAITDDWRVMGLRGTGSDSYAVTDLFVPEDYTVRRDVPAEQRTEGTLYRFSTTHLYASGFAGVALGVARGMLDAFVALGRAKTPILTARALRDSPVVQTLAARSEARWRAARSLLMETLREAWATAAAGEALSLEQKVSIRLATTFAIQDCRAMVEDLYQEAGSTAIFEDNPFERRFRDMHAISQQIQGRSTHFETVGQHLLGLDVPLRFV